MLFDELGDANDLLDVFLSHRRVGDVDVYGAGFHRNLIFFDQPGESPVFVVRLDYWTDGLKAPVAQLGGVFDGHFEVINGTSTYIPGQRRETDLDVLRPLRRLGRRLLGSERGKRRHP